MKWRRNGVKAGRNGGAEPQMHAAHEAAHAQPDARRSDPGCGCAHSGLPHLQELVADPHEALAISLIRFVFAGYCTGNVAAWDQGFEAAASALGHDGGSVFFSRVLTLGRAVKVERLGDFEFMPSHCRRISEDEIELLGALQAARRRDPRLLDQALLILSRQTRSERIRAALRGLADLIGMIIDEVESTSASDALARAPAGVVLH